MREQKVPQKNEALQNVVKPQVSKQEEKKQNKAILIGLGCFAAAATALTIIGHKQEQSLIKILKKLDVVKTLNQQADNLLAKAKSLTQRIAK